jgi:hypothetical protein
MRTTSWPKSRNVNVDSKVHGRLLKLARVPATFRFLPWQMLDVRRSRRLLFETYCPPLR